jgi:hypothetical protein
MVARMKQIRQSMDYEGPNSSELRQALQQWHVQHSFDAGIDWQYQYMYATMTDEDCLAFCLKYPQFANRFRTV